MKTFKLFLESTYKAQDGESEILHHTSPHDFNEFKPFSHFGTKQAAGARAIDMFDGDTTKNKTNIYSVRLKKGNEARIGDPKLSSFDIDDEDINPDEYTDKAKGYLYNLHTFGHITKQEHDTLNKKYESMPDEESRINHLSNYLRTNKNIHTLTYGNTEEDPGYDSHIITHPDQVRILRKSYGKINTTKDNDGFSKKYPKEFQGMTRVRDWGRENQ